MNPSLRSRVVRARTGRSLRADRSFAEPLERRVLLTVFYVDDTAAGPAHDGVSWATAYSGLQAALAAANGTAGADEIRVAAGTYRPTARTDGPDPRSATFSLFDGVSILGGYPDGGGTARDPAAHVATLSGDLGVPDSAADNAYHVVSTIDVGDTAFLDGLTITRGNADVPQSAGRPEKSNGGGMYIVRSSPRVARCTFTGNSVASYGGAVFTGEGSSPTITACAFVGNFAEVYGAGVASFSGSSPVLTDSTFESNVATSGAGVNIVFANATVLRCTFRGNVAYESGGGITASNSNVVVTDSTFVANVVGAEGGAVFSEFASPAITHCAFSGNWAGYQGGAVSLMGGSPVLTNCTFSGNSAGSQASAVYAQVGFPLLVNCIAWGNATPAPGAAQIFHGGIHGGTTVRHSLVEGGWPGEDNVSADPLFVRNPSPGPDGRWGTKDQPSADDDYGDLRLRGGSPGIDAGDTSAVPSGLMTDLAGRPRVQGPEVDIGAYEQPPAVSQLYQAERAALTGAAVSASHAGFTGGGFVDYLHASGDAVEFTVQAPYAGWYDLSFRYANGGTAARAVALSVNGAAVPEGVAFARTGSWTAWRSVTRTVQLNAGDNRVRLSARGQSGPNLDSLTVRASQAPAVGTYQAELAVRSGVAFASDQAGYTGSGYADYQHASGDFVEFTVDVAAGGAGALDFRYANGSRADRPVELRVDGRVLAGRFSFAPTGGWRTWKTVSQPVSLAAGRHTVRLTAVGQSGPNLDALTVRPPPDVTPPRVVGLSVQRDQVVPAGDVTVTVRFSEPMMTSNLTYLDVYFDTGMRIGFNPDSMGYDASGTVLTIRFNNMLDDYGMLAFDGGDGGFEDLAGNNLDGQPTDFPIPPNVSGDGVPDGDFSYWFAVDTLGPLSLGQAPADGITFPVDSVLAPSGDSDSFAVTAAAGQTIAAAVSAEVDGMLSGITLSVELRNDAGDLLASAAAPGMYRDVALAPVAAPAAGTYTIVVRALPGEFGRFRGAVTVGAAPPRE